MRRLGRFSTVSGCERSPRIAGLWFGALLVNADADGRMWYGLWACGLLFPKDADAGPGVTSRARDPPQFGNVRVGGCRGKSFRRVVHLGRHAAHRQDVSFVTRVACRHGSRMYGSRQGEGRRNSNRERQPADEDEPCGDRIGRHWAGFCCRFAPHAEQHLVFAVRVPLAGSVFPSDRNACGAPLRTPPSEGWLRADTTRRPLVCITGVALLLIGIALRAGPGLVIGSPGLG